VILFTGGNGFIGSKLKAKLVADQIEYCQFYSESLKFLPPLEEINNDITALVICGSYVAHSAEESDDEAQACKSKRTLDVLLSHTFPNLRTVVYLSTCDVYEDTAHINENSKVVIRNLYIQTKVEQENLIKEYCSSLGIVSLILRVGNVYGPGEFKFKKLIPRIVECAINQEDLKLSIVPESKLQPIYVGDVVNVIIEALRIDESSQVINLVGVETLSIDDLVTEVSKLAKVSISVHPESKYHERTFDPSKLLSSTKIEFTKFTAGISEEYKYEIARLNRY
jgi:nucleoside-diphosphate-sugar epimerase